MYITCIKNMTCNVRKHYQKLKTAALICLLYIQYVIDMTPVVRVKLYNYCHEHDFMKQKRNLPQFNRESFRNKQLI